MNNNQRDLTAQVKKKWVRLTRVCNNRCLFCLDKNAQNGSHLSLAEIKKVFQAGRKEKAEKVILSGGEPTLHPKFIDIVKKAKKLGYTKIQVITNGRMFAYKKFLDQAINAGVGEVTFSIHGHNQRLHDKQTGVKGSFFQTLAGLAAALQTQGLIVNVDIVINKINIRYLKDIIEFYINSGVLEFDLLQVMPFGRAWDNREVLFYDIEESLPFLNEAFQLSRDPNLHIWTNRFPPEYLEGFEDLIQHPVKLYDEVGGRRDMFDRFLNNGKKMDCKGKKCSYCFLENFCKDVILLKEKGELTSHVLPFCLKEAKETRDVKMQCKYTLSKDNRGIFKFLSFYIQHRYFIKGLRCKKCKFNDRCTGMQCDYIRNHGFQVLKPILDKRTKYKQTVLQKNIPYRLLRLNLACNANCLFCNVPPESYPLQEMSTQQAKSEIDRLIALDKELRLDITGGEPTLRGDLEELIEYASKKGAKVIEIQTNGILLANKEYVKKLKLAGLGKAFLALHSCYPEIHDFLVGRKGAFEKCVTGIKNLLKAGVEVILNPVITVKNYECLPDYIKFIKNNFPRIKSVSLSVVQPRGRAGNNKYLIPRYKVISSHIRKALTLAKKYGLIIYNPYCGVPLCIGGWHRYPEQCVEYCENLLKSKSGFGEDDFNADKVKSPDCCKCDLNNFCNGVWKEYAAIYSFSDLKPVRLKKQAI